MANKSKDKTEIVDAEVVEETQSSDEALVLDDQKKPKIDEPLIDTDADETAQDTVEDVKEDPTPDPVEEIEDVAEETTDTDDEEQSTSLSARVLRGLFLIFIGIAVALWGAPKLAPMLPSGLAPVAAFLMPGQSESKAEIAALRESVDSRLAELSAAPKDAVNQDAIDSAIAAYDAAKSEELAKIKDTLAATDGQGIEARIAALETQMTGVSAELKAVSERLTLQITENGTALSEEAGAKLSGYLAILEGLKAQVADLSAKNGALSQKVEEIATASARRVEEAEAQASTKVANSTTKKLLTEIAAALDSGSPFKPALDGLVETADVTAPEALTNVAQTGTPSWTTLRNGFTDAAHAALRVDAKDNAGDGVMGKFGAFLKTQVGTRSLERIEGDTTDAILSRVEDDLVNRRLAAALTEANSLPDGPKAEMADWIANLDALAQAQTALDQLNTSLGAT